jgi:hypothetical protein
LEVNMGEKDVGFVGLGKTSGETKVSGPEIGVGVLGYAFMGKAHTNAYKKIPYIFWPPPAVPRRGGGRPLWIRALDDRLA